MVAGGIVWALLTWTWNGLGLAGLGIAFGIGAVWNLRRVQRSKPPKRPGFWYDPS